MGLPHLIGFLAAMLMLCGRWEFSRLTGSYEVEAGIALQPRTWIVAMIALISLAMTGARWVGRLTVVDSLVALFFVYMMMARLWSFDPELGDLKLQETMLAGIAYLCLSFACAAFGSHRVQEGFWVTAVLVGIGLVVLAFVARGHNGRFCTPGGGPIPFGRNMGLMALGMLHLSASRGGQWKLYAGVVAAVGVLAILYSGSRGALFSTSAAVATLALLSSARISTKLGYMAGLGVCTAIAILGTEAGASAAQVFRERIVEATFQDGYLASRDDLWLLAIELIGERPFFGWGLNGFMANSWIYPHNLFLEVASEGGIVGLTLLVLPIAACFISWRLQPRAVSPGCIAAVVLVLSSAQTSGDIYDSRGVFLLLILTSHLAASTLPATQPAPEPSRHRTCVRDGATPAPTSGYPALHA